jgi:hypothetical protein
MGNAKEQARRWVEEESRTARPSVSWIRTCFGGNERGAAASIVLEVEGEYPVVHVHAFGEDGARFERLAMQMADAEVKRIIELRQQFDAEE